MDDTFSHFNGHVFVELPASYTLRAVFYLAQIPGATFSVSPCDDMRFCTLAVPEDQAYMLRDAIRYAEGWVSQPATHGGLNLTKIQNEKGEQQHALVSESGRTAAVFGSGKQARRDAEVIAFLWSAWNGRSSLGTHFRGATEAELEAAKIKVISNRL